MDLLAKAQNMKDTSSLYEIHISDILSTVKVSCCQNIICTYKLRDVY